MTNEEWSRAICRVNQSDLQKWMAEHPAPDRMAVAAATPRDNYGLVGKSGKKAKPNDGRWQKFQEAVPR